MTDRQSTPPPATEPVPESAPPEDATAQATQVIRTQDPTLTIQQPAEGSDPTLAIPQPGRVAEPTMAMPVPTPAAKPAPATPQPTPAMPQPTPAAKAAPATPEPTWAAEPPPATPEPARTTSHAAAWAKAEADRAREAAEKAQIVADRSRWKAEDAAAQPWYMRKRVVLPSAVVAAFAFLMITTGGNDSGLFRAVSNAANPSAQGIPHAPPASAVMGQSVRDGKFAFMVTGVPKPTKSFTDRFGVKQSAQGVFVIVRLKVSNIGYDARSLNPTDLFLVDNQGKRFATSSAVLTLGGAETIFLHKINPGHIVNNAPVVFDVPPGTVIASIELHDSLASRGVQVKLP